MNDVDDAATCNWPERQHKAPSRQVWADIFDDADQQTYASLILGTCAGNMTKWRIVGRCGRDLALHHSPIETIGRAKLLTCNLPCGEGADTFGSERLTGAVPDSFAQRASVTA